MKVKTCISCLRTIELSLGAHCIRSSRCKYQAYFCVPLQLGDRKKKKNKNKKTQRLALPITGHHQSLN